MSIVTNLSYEEALALPGPKNIWLDGSKVIVDTTPIKTIPSTITAFQARIALTEQGLLEQVETAVNAKNGDTKIRWEWAGELNRNHQDVLDIAKALGWTVEQLDDLFILAYSK